MLAGMRESGHKRQAPTDRQADRQTEESVAGNAAEAAGSRQERMLQCAKLAGSQPVCTCDSAGGARQYLRAVWPQPSACAPLYTHAPQQGAVSVAGKACDAHGQVKVLMLIGRAASKADKGGQGEKGG